MKGTQPKELNHDTDWFNNIIKLEQIQDKKTMNISKIKPIKEHSIDTYNNTSLENSIDNDISIIDNFLHKN